MASIFQTMSLGFLGHEDPKEYGKRSCKRLNAVRTVSCFAPPESVKLVIPKKVDVLAERTRDSEV